MFYAHEKLSEVRTRYLVDQKSVCLTYNLRVLGVKCSQRVKIHWCNTRKAYAVSFGPGIS